MQWKDELEDAQRTLKIWITIWKNCFQNDRSEKNIKEYERSIERLKSEIKINEKNRNEIWGVIRQKQVVESFSGSPEAKELEDKNLKIWINKKTSSKDNESMHQDIDDFESKIKTRKNQSIKIHKILFRQKESIKTQENLVKSIEEIKEHSLKYINSEFIYVHSFRHSFCCCLDWKVLSLTLLWSVQCKKDFSRSSHSQYPWLCYE